MSERLQAARAELLRLIERYVRPVNLGQAAYTKLSAAMDELHDAAREAERVVLGVVDEVKGAADLLNSNEGPAQAVVDNEPAQPGVNDVLNTFASMAPHADEAADADHPSEGQPHA